MAEQEDFIDELDSKIRLYETFHNDLANWVRWRAEADSIWQSEVMTDLGNNTWQGQFSVATPGRYRF